MKTTRESVNIIDAFHQLGSYRAAARLLGTTHKTVRRAVERQQAGGPWSRRPRPISKNTDQVIALIGDRVRATDGRISAKRLLPSARAAGYHGSGRNFRRAVAKVKAEWRQKRRIYRPWVASPGQHLVIDWTRIGLGLHMFCAVLAWSRYRFVRFASNETRETTLGLLAECFEEVGAVAAVVLSDRRGCLRNGIVANVVVPHPDYVRFAAHYGFRPDFCEAADPESKGVVENLVGYAQRDLVVPNDFAGNLGEANRQAKLWGIEVNGRIHSEIPALCRGALRKVDKTQTIRFGSARYSLPTGWVGKLVEVSVVDHELVLAQDGREIDRHRLMAPGEVSIKDEHYQGRARVPARAVRIRTGIERAFLGLGPAAEAFLRSAAVAGTSRLAAELADIVALEPSWGREPLLAALERATRFRRFKAQDVRNILAAGLVAPNPVPAGKPLNLQLPDVPVRALSAYALEQVQ
ncbi:MAG TPA: IS21 family transposase [Candidatus Dormibacteraeota bacterium]